MIKDSESLEHLIKTFELAEQKVNKVLFNSNPKSVKELKIGIDTALNSINLELREQTSKWATKDLEDAYIEGQKKVDKNFNGSDKVDNNRVLNPYIELSKTISKVAEDTKANINSIIDQSLKDGKTSIFAVKKTLQEEMLKQNGSMVVRYSNGAKMPLSAYSSMVARTARIETVNTGSMDRCKFMNIDLVKCTIVPNCCPFCHKYEGKVYSITGNDKRFPSLYGDDGPFQHGYNIMHPNCRHEFLPYIEDLQSDEQLRQDIKESNHFTNYNVNDKIFKKYQENQSKQRQYREEFKQYSRLKSELGESMPYKTLGGFRRASRHYKEKYPNQPNKIKDFDIRVRLKSDLYLKLINVDKQNRHFKENAKYVKDKSYLSIPLKECQEIVYKTSGAGKISYTSNGKFNNQEIIECHRIVGFVKSLDGTWKPTTKLKIHYSKTGTHIVPTLKGE